MCVATLFCLSGSPMMLCYRAWQSSRHDKTAERGGRGVDGKESCAASVQRAVSFWLSRAPPLFRRRSVHRTYTPLSHVIAHAHRLLLPLLPLSLHLPAGATRRGVF
jgi:hypothetical protein